MSATQNRRWPPIHKFTQDQINENLVQQNQGMHVTVYPYIRTHTPTPRSFDVEVDLDWGIFGRDLERLSLHFPPQTYFVPWPKVEAEIKRVIVDASINAFVWYNKQVLKKPNGSE